MCPYLVNETHGPFFSFLQEGPKSLGFPASTLTEGSYLAGDRNLEQTYFLEIQSHRSCLGRATPQSSVLNTEPMFYGEKGYRHLCMDHQWPARLPFQPLIKNHSQKADILIHTKSSLTPGGGRNRPLSDFEINYRPFFKPLCGYFSGDIYLPHTLHTFNCIPSQDLLGPVSFLYHPCGVHHMNQSS